MSTSTLETYTTAFVSSKDGATIGYRQMGSGPAVILVHGGMQAAQNFMKLAEALADQFTVIVPDRRGRGLSSPYREDHTIQADVEDIEALLEATGAHNVFALSAGAVIALQSALTLPQIEKLALYEPPLSIDGSISRGWLTRLDQELAADDLASAMVTVMKGTEDTSFFTALPRFVTVPLIRQGIKAEAQDRKDGDAPLGELVRSMKYDTRIVFSMADTLPTFKNVRAEVLLLGGSRSASYLKLALDHLEKTLPHVRRVEFPGFDHLAADNSGHPERVAEELRRFFSQP